MTKKTPRICILKTDGINCDEEMVDAFATAGGEPRIVHINELRARQDTLKNYHILAIPGGFSYGDDVASGKILALELQSYLGDQISDFVQKKGLVLGVCNGFQVLIRTGLLPFNTLGEMKATLTNNESGHFECRWIHLNYEATNACVFLKGSRESISLQVAHGEGRLFANQKEIKNIEAEKLVALRYCDESGKPTQTYPQNPNGSLNAIAALTDPTGRILGIMPHPERFIRKTQHPNWRSLPKQQPHGLPIFEKMVAYVVKS